MKKLRYFIILLIVLFFSSLAYANQSYQNDFDLQYPSSQFVGKCSVCHIAVINPLNDYGKEFRDNPDFNNIMLLDSDGDGIDNLTEIIDGSSPGDKTAIPAIVGIPPKIPGNITAYFHDPGPAFEITGVPFTLASTAPESASVTVKINYIPSGTTSIDVVLTVWDPDFVDEGRLIINGQTPLVLFADGSADKDSLVVTLNPINTAVGWYQVGDNTFEFWHDSTQGYRIDNIDINFIK